MWRTFVRAVALALLALSLLPRGAASGEKSPKQPVAGTLKGVSIDAAHPVGGVKRMSAAHPKGVAAAPPPLSFYPPDDL
jgi:hypothetical protein